jgi:PAS domain S-box-containing protein
MQLRLTHKGLLLVAIPLAFELIFVASLTWLLERSEEAEQRAAYLKDVTSQTNGVVTLLYESASSLISYHVARKDLALRRHYEELLIDIRNRFARLEKLVGDDPNQQAALKEIEPDLKTTLTFIQSLKDAIDRNDELAAVYSVSSWSDNIRGPFRRLTLHLKELVDYQTDKLKAFPEEEERMRRMIKQCLALGVGLNIVIAFWVALMVTKGMTRRVESLMENSQRLAAGKELQPVQKGNDEIAKLDLVFHDMASALQAAALKERNTMEQIKASEAHIRSIIESMLVGLIVIDDAGLIESCNARTEELFGCKQEDMAGTEIGALFCHDGNGGGAGFLCTLKEGALGHVKEFAALKKNGESFPVEVTLNEFHSATKNRFLVNLLDVSERHQIERMKKEFVAMVSHDLRTPLNSVLISMSLLSAGALGELTEKGRRIVSDSESELERLIQLTNDLLDIARMEAGRMEFHFTEVALANVIDTSISAMRGVAQSKAIVLSPCSTDITLIGDKDRLIQVLVNLLSNAIKFSPENSTITITAEIDEDKARVCVKDEGRGVPEEFRQSIFERFQQVASADATESGGSGLGLAIGKMIIEGHGGVIGVSSNDGPGSTFWFSIPLARPVV